MQGFEKRLEKLVEGTFGKAFRSGLEPVEVGRKVTRALDADRAIGVDGVPIAPNNIGVYLAHEDFERFSAFADALARELAETAREHARAEGYHFVGPVTVTLVGEERATMVDRQYKNYDFDMAMPADFLGMGPDPGNAISSHYKSSSIGAGPYNNGARYSNPTMDKLLTDVGQEADDAKRYAFFCRAVFEALREQFRALHVSADAMTTGAAVRTYNVLVAERRRVAYWRTITSPTSTLEETSRIWAFWLSAVAAR